MQTAVEWLYNKLSTCTSDEMVGNINNWFEQAKQMEKEQIMNAWDNRCKQGTFISGWHIETKNGEQYYAETYDRTTDTK